MRLSISMLADIVTSQPNKPAKIQTSFSQRKCSAFSAQTWFTVCLTFSSPFPHFAFLAVFYTFFSKSTPFFQPSLDDLIFWPFSASNVLKGVLNFISNKFLEACFKIVVRVISDEKFNSSKRDHNVYQKLMSNV